MILLVGLALAGDRASRDPCFQLTKKVPTGQRVESVSVERCTRAFVVLASSRARGRVGKCAGRGTASRRGASVKLMTQTQVVTAILAIRKRWRCHVRRWRQPRLKRSVDVVLVSALSSCAVSRGRLSVTRALDATWRASDRVGANSATGSALYTVNADPVDGLHLAPVASHWDVHRWTATCRAGSIASSWRGQVRDHLAKRGALREVLHHPLAGRQFDARGWVSRHYSTPRRYRQS